MKEATAQSLKFNRLGFDGNDGWHGQLLERLGDLGAT
jgi:hypothetical protein